MEEDIPFRCSVDGRRLNGNKSFGSVEADGPVGNCPRCESIILVSRSAVAVTERGLLQTEAS